MSGIFTETVNFSFKMYFSTSYLAANMFPREKIGSKKFVTMSVSADVSGFLYFSFTLLGHDAPLEKGLWQPHSEKFLLLVS